MSDTNPYVSSTSSRCQLLESEKIPTDAQNVYPTSSFDLSVRSSSSCFPFLPLLDSNLSLSLLLATRRNQHSRRRLSAHHCRGNHNQFDPSRFSRRSSHLPSRRVASSLSLTSPLLSPPFQAIGGQGYVLKFRPTSENSVSAMLLEPPFEISADGNWTR